MIFTIEEIRRAASQRGGEPLYTQAMWRSMVNTLLGNYPPVMQKGSLTDDDIKELINAPGVIGFEIYEDTCVIHTGENMHTKSEELRDRNSCLNKAGPNEPVFTLLGRDACAAATIRLWAAMAQTEHGSVKAERAIQDADWFEKWREANKEDLMMRKSVVSASELGASLDRVNSEMRESIDQYHEGLVMLSERASFEAFAASTMKPGPMSSAMYFKRDDVGGYKTDRIQVAWEAWWARSIYARGIAQQERAANKNAATAGNLNGAKVS